MDTTVRCAALLTVAIVFLAAPAEACQCSVGASLIGGFHQAAAVFEGTATKIESINGPATFAGAERVHFAVTRVWKGSRSADIVVQTDGSNCSYPFIPGATYVVFAYPSEAGDGRLETSICTRTKGGVFRLYERVILGSATWKPDQK